MSHNMQTLLSTAAELRSGGHSWDSVASQVRRSVKTVQQWPLRYVNDWKLFYRQAQKKRHEEAASEALCCLRHLLNGEDERVRVKAADCLLKFEQMEEVEEELSEEDYEMQKMVSDYRIRHQAACKAVNYKREQQGLAPLAGKALRDAGHHFLVELFCGGKVARGEDEKEKPRPSTGASDASNSTLDTTKTLVVLWFLLSLSLLGFLGYRDSQRNGIDRTNPFFVSTYPDTINYLTQRSREIPSFDRPISWRKEFSSPVSIQPHDVFFAPLFGEMDIGVDVLNVIVIDDSMEDPDIPSNFEVAPLVLEIFDSGIEENIHPLIFTHFVGINNKDSLVIEEVANATKLAHFASGSFEEVADFDPFERDLSTCTDNANQLARGGSLFSTDLLPTYLCEGHSPPSADCS